MGKMASLAEVMRAYPDMDWMYSDGIVTVFDGDVTVAVIDLKGDKNA